VKKLVKKEKNQYYFSKKFGSIQKKLTKKSKFIKKNIKKKIIFFLFWTLSFKTK